MQELLVYQSLWAMEQRRPGVAEAPVEEMFDRVAAAGYDGMAMDLGALNIDAARAVVPQFARAGLGGLLLAFPRSIEDLRPAIHVAKEIGSPVVIIVGQLFPVRLDEMIEAVRGWLRVAAEEGMPVQFETHRNCITNDLYTTLQLLDAIPELRLCADLSHYVVDREMVFPIWPHTFEQISRVLARSDSFQGRIASRNQIQIALDFPQHRKWLDLFEGWWTEGFTGWRARSGPDDRLIFVTELGPPEYAITDRNGDELSDRWEEAKVLRRMAGACWERSAPA